MKRLVPCVLVLALHGQPFFAQVQPDTPAWTTAQDHQHTMTQLGIRMLRPGPSGNESAPNPANYDETLANPYPDLPQLLTLDNGRKVTSAAMWWKQRRPEIVEQFDREVLGRVPKNVPKLVPETPIRSASTSGRAASQSTIGLPTFVHRSVE